MENKFDWDNFRFFIGGREIKGFVPINFRKPKHIQEVTNVLITPNSRRWHPPMVLFLN